MSGYYVGDDTPSLEPDEPRAPVPPTAGAAADQSPPPASQAEWEAHAVRRLRGHLGDTQAEFADRLGTRQQTVSEWETGTSRPRRMAQRLLHMVAEERGFYSVAGDPSEATPADEARDP